MGKHSVFVQQPILAPYRLSFQRELAQSKSLRPTVAYGAEIPGSALISVRDPEGISTIFVRNRFVGSKAMATIQAGIVEALDPKVFDTLICVYDPRIVTTTLLVLKARRHGIRVIFWGHGIRPRGRFKGLYKWLASIADAVLLYSGRAKEALVQLGVDESKLFVAWNSIDTHEIALLREESPLSDRSGILCIGRLIPEKKVLLLVEGFAKAVPQLGEGANLVIIGSGPERQPAEALARELGIESRVTFVPECYQEEEIAQWMNRCWVAVSPGYVGLSIIHAFAYGLPMLAANPEPHSPEIEALREGKNGAFFRADDAQDLAANLISLRGDKIGLNAMGIAARETSGEFSVQAMVESFENAVAYAHGEELDRANPTPHRVSRKQVTAR